MVTLQHKQQQEQQKVRFEDFVFFRKGLATNQPTNHQQQQLQPNKQNNNIIILYIFNYIHICISI